MSNSGLIFDIRRFSVHDGPGIRTTVFFKGCPLSCWWCHNPESRDPEPEKSVKHHLLNGNKFDREETTGKWMSVGEVLQEVDRDRIFYDESDGGVTFSGGEPLLQEKFLIELLKTCREQGIHTVLDTSGYSTKATMTRVSGWVDLFLYDLKLMDDHLHRKYTGVSNKSILENLEFLVNTGNNVVLRFPVIPGITDTQGNIREMKTFIADGLINLQSDEVTKRPLQLCLLPYHSMAHEKYHRFGKPNQLADLPELKNEDLLPLKNEFESIGLLVSIGG